MLTGFSGMLILFLWFGTDHLATKANYNALWAFAPNAIIGFLILKEKVPKWIKFYLILLIVMLFITCILWMFKIQVFSILLILVILALAIRYLFLLYHFKNVIQPKK
tara:strand:- start:1284 stop:1604 length:321 start_codon:yes stop_codon:yes gene_type:complete